MTDSRQRISFVLAIGAGLAIALVDSSPGWDDSGVTAGLLVLAAAVAAGISGRRPWLWAVLVGGWTPLVEILRGAGLAPLIALAFSAAGAAAGYLVARLAARTPTAQG